MLKGMNSNKFDPIVDDDDDVDIDEQVLRNISFEPAFLKLSQHSRWWIYNIFKNKQEFGRKEISWCRHQTFF